MKITILKLADKDYGVSINQVNEVIRMREITPVPDSADFVEGVISLQGFVVPIVNFRKKLNLSEAKLTRHNRIIITELNKKPVGVIVDSISDVITVDDESITPPDDVLRQADYLIGVGKIIDRLILIVDISKLLNAQAKTGINSIYKKVEIRKK